jgi:hypothetical protein
MPRTIANMVSAVHERTHMTPTYVEQRARVLQNNGLLQLGRGATARPRDCANVLLSLSADKVRHATALVNRYSDLKRLGADNTKAGDALEALVTEIWAGDRDAADKTIRIVQSWPEIIIAERDEEQHAGLHFYDDEQIMEMHALFDVRRSIEIPGRVIAQIGGDLGMRGCQYAV